MNRQRLSAIWLACTLPALAACSTEDIRGHFLVPSDQGGPDKGGVVVGFSPTEDTYQAAEQELTNLAPTQYHLFIDGEVVSEPDADWLFTTVVGGNVNWVYYLGAGPHHFAIAASGQAPVFQGDGQVPGGGTVNLFLYGPLDEVKGVLAPIPRIPSAGNEHITVVNLMRNGQSIEVVTCNDATTCTPISAGLALSDVFDAEVPAAGDDCDPSSPSSIPGSWSGGCFTSLTTTGAGIGYRLVPTASLPNPPVNALTWGVSDSLSINPRPPIFVAAPVFMTDDGRSQFVFD
jgi:hypothetical protein